MRFAVRELVVLGVALLVGFGAFLAWTVGLAAYQRAQAVPDASAPGLALPERLPDPPAYAPTTQSWGPPGPIALVLRGRTGHQGFAEEVADPWYVVSARTGGYRLLVAPHLDEAVGGVRLSPDGSRVAWVWPGGVQHYDAVDGSTRTHAVKPGGGPGGGPRVVPGSLAWSPDGARLAMVTAAEGGRGNVAVVDVEDDSVRSLPLRVPTGRADTLSWTGDGRWLTYPAATSIEAVAVDSGARRSLGAELGAFRDPEWGPDGGVAGLHPLARRNVIRVARTRGFSAAAAAAAAAPGRDDVEVVDAAPRDLVLERFWGWVDGDEVVVTGLRPETGALDHVVSLSLSSGAVYPYMEVPSTSENWADIATVSVATGLLDQPTRDYEEPAQPWSPVAKLALCLLVAVFPAVYYLLARRPRPHRR